jgi:hypothetical protein
MSKLIYFSVPLVAGFDQHVLDKQYKYHHWFEMKNILEWPVHITSRINTLDTPWPLASSVCAMPQITSNELNFGKVIEYIADEFCKRINQSDQTPYICWSGGIDSTSILVSLLKVANTEFLKKLVVLHDQSSIQENAYFYHKFIDKKIRTEPLDTFSITADNYKQIVLLDGEAGNQCLGWRSINVLAYHREFDLLAQPWRNIQDFNSILPGCTEFARQMICDSIPHAPISIDSVYDFLWWTNFNFKFDDVLLRKAHSYTQNLNADQCQYFWKNNLNRFYAHPLMQQWSMLSKDLRREKTKILGKYHAKEYIYNFDHNELWYVNKKEESSDSQLFYESRFMLDGAVIFAIDQDWNKYSLTDVESRQKLGKILQRS